LKRVAIASTAGRLASAADATALLIIKIDRGEIISKEEVPFTSKTLEEVLRNVQAFVCRSPTHTITEMCREMSVSVITTDLLEIEDVIESIMNGKLPLSKEGEA